jgi:hypothetical protein
LPEDENSGGVAAEGCDVVADPLECEYEVDLADVAGVAEEIVGRGRAKLGEVEVAEEVEAVVESDDDYVSAAGQTDAIVDGTIGGAGGVGSAVDVDEDWALAIVESGCPEIEMETVFGVDGIGFIERGEGGAALPGMDGLRGLRAEGHAVADTGPRLGRDWWSEASGGRVGAVRNAFEDEDSLSGGTADFACGGGGDGRRGLRVELRGEEGACGKEGGALEEVAPVHGFCLSDHGTCGREFSHLRHDEATPEVGFGSGLLTDDLQNLFGRLQRTF